MLARERDRAVHFIHRGAAHLVHRNGASLRQHVAVHGGAPVVRRTVRAPDLALLGESHRLGVLERRHSRPSRVAAGAGDGTVVRRDLARASANLTNSALPNPRSTRRGACACPSAPPARAASAPPPGSSAPRRRRSFQDGNFVGKGSSAGEVICFVLCQSASWKLTSGLGRDASRATRSLRRPRGKPLADRGERQGEVRLR